MLKFMPGILLLQAITIALVLMAPADLENWGWLRLAVPVLIVGFLTAFWFGSVAAHQRKGEISRLKELHAKERETIRVNAERAKTRLIKQSQHKTLQEVRRSSMQTSIRVGLAFAGAAAFGGLLVLTQFMSLGVLTLAAVGGALGGYTLRFRQEKAKLQFPRNGPDTPQIGDETSQKAKQIYRAGQ
jgi:Flp pilus assembly protein TadB